MSASRFGETVEEHEPDASQIAENEHRSASRLSSAVAVSEGQPKNDVEFYDNLGELTSRMIEIMDDVYGDGKPYRQGNLQSCFAKSEAKNQSEDEAESSDSSAESDASSGDDFLTASSSIRDRDGIVFDIEDSKNTVNQMLGELKTKERLEVMQDLSGWFHAKVSITMKNVDDLNAQELKSSETAIQHMQFHEDVCADIDHREMKTMNMLNEFYHALHSVTEKGSKMHLQNNLHLLVC